MNFIEHKARIGVTSGKMDRTHKGPLRYGRVLSLKLSGWHILVLLFFRPYISLVPYDISHTKEV